MFSEKTLMREWSGGSTPTGASGLLSLAEPSSDSLVNVKIKKSYVKM